MTATQRLIAAGPGRYPNPLDTSRLAGSGTRSSIPRERRSTRKLLATSANLVTWIWYPAAAPHGSEPAAYLPAGWQPVDQLLGVDSAAAACHAIGDAPLSGERAAYPVLFLSPSGFPPLMLAAIAEELASHLTDDWISDGWAPRPLLRRQRRSRVVPSRRQVPRGGQPGRRIVERRRNHRTEPSGVANPG